MGIFGIDYELEQEEGWGHVHVSLLLLFRVGVVWGIKKDIEGVIG